jgi:competence protein ComEC
VLSDRPDLLVSGDGHLMAVRGNDGELSLSKPRGSRITTGTWVRRDGSSTPAVAWPEEGSGAAGALSCDPLGCVYRRGRWTAALLRDPLAADEDCRSADVVVTPEPIRRCPARVTIDPRALARDGAYAIWFDEDRIRVETVRQWRGVRPWTGG